MAEQSILQPPLKFQILTLSVFVFECVCACVCMYIYIYIVCLFALFMSCIALFYLGCWDYISNVALLFLVGENIGLCLLSQLLFTRIEYQPCSFVL